MRMGIRLASPIPNLRSIIGNIKIKRNQAFREIAKEGKADIKVELRSPKSGNSKPARRISRYRNSPVRRSASGESLARDTGASEKLITSSQEGDSLKVGFLQNPSGVNYVRNQEEDNNRPTVRKSMERTLPKAIAAMNRNFQL